MNRYQSPAYPPIHPDTLFGENVRIGHYVIIEEGCEIGDDTFLGNFIVLRPHTKIGKGCSILSYVHTSGPCTIGDFVNIRYSTHISAGTIIEPLVFIGGGTLTMNDRKIVWKRSNEIFVPNAPIIKRGARIGGGCIILPGVTVGENSQVAAGSIVTRDVPMGMVVMGSPAKIVREVPREEWL